MIEVKIHFENEDDKDQLIQAKFENMDEIPAWFEKIKCLGDNCKIKRSVGFIKRKEKILNDDSNP